MKHPRGKTVRTALDDLDYGPLKSPDAYGKVKKAVVPEGVSTGRLRRDIMLIAWPSFVELLLTQLTSMADQIMVGQMPGAMGVYGLTAVGLASMPKFLMMTLVTAMNVGTTAIVARARGQQDRRMANRVFRQAVFFNLLLSAVLMVLGLASAEWMIGFMGGSGITAETLALSTEYLRIQFWGFVPLCLNFTITAALRGVGDTRTPMIYNTVANVVNLFFNYVMIYGKLGCPVMGVAGASWATVIGQTVAFAMAAKAVLGRGHYLRIRLGRRFRFNWNIIRDIAAIGVPSMIEQLIMRLGIILFQRSVAGLGDNMYATHQVVSNIQSMSLMIGQSFGNASTTLMGQSLGKRRFDMAAIYMKLTRSLGLLVSCAGALLMVIFNEEFIRLYNTTPEVVAAGANLLWMIAFLVPVQGDQFIVSGGLRGVGDTRYPAMVALVCTVVVRMSICWVMVDLLELGLYGAWVAIISDMVLRAVLMLRRYRSGKWKARVRKRNREEAAAQNC